MILDIATILMVAGVSFIVITIVLMVVTEMKHMLHFLLMIGFGAILLLVGAAVYLYFGGLL